MKALLLSGGKGTRLHPITYTNAKQLIPIANKPVLFYAIEALVAAEIYDIGIVVGDTYEEIKAAIDDSQFFEYKVRITYIHQQKSLGLPYAVKIAHHFIEDERFIMFLGDNFIEEIEHSIVLEGCDIRNIEGRIEDSLIGRYVQLYPSSEKPKAYKLLLGDHSQVGIL